MRVKNNYLNFFTAVSLKESEQNLVTVPCNNNNYNNVKWSSWGLMYERRTFACNQSPSYFFVYLPVLLVFVFVCVKPLWFFVVVPLCFFCVLIFFVVVSEFRISAIMWTNEKTKRTNKQNKQHFGLFEIKKKIMNFALLIVFPIIWSILF